MYTYQATVLRVLDGDSAELRAEVGFYITFTHIFRVQGIDSPEIRTAAGKAARDWAVSMLPAGLQVTIRTAKADKYGRWLAAIELPGGIDYAQLAISTGHAVPYDGGARA